MLADQIGEFGDQLEAVLMRKASPVSDKENAELEMGRLNKSSLDETLNTSVLVKRDIPRQIDQEQRTQFQQFPLELLQH